jgi:hypothetical protein
LRENLKILKGKEVVLGRCVWSSCIRELAAAVAAEGEIGSGFRLTGKDVKVVYNISPLMAAIIICQ